MKISDLVNQLNEMKSEHGDVEVTQIGIDFHLGSKEPFADAFESTIETLIFKDDEFAGEESHKRILAVWQM